MPKKSSQAGLSPILIIVGVLVVVLIIVGVVSGGLKGNITVTKTDGTQSTETQKEPSSTGDAPAPSNVPPKLYTNDTYNFTVKYPGNWTMKEGNVDPIVSFISPPVDANDRFTENVIVGVTDISNFPEKTVAFVMDLWLQQNQADTTFTEFEVLLIENATMSGFPAQQSTYKASSRGTNIKGSTAIAIAGDYAYIFTYSAEASSFDTYLKDFVGILGSVYLTN